MPNAENYGPDELEAMARPRQPCRSCGRLDELLIYKYYSMGGERGGHVTSQTCTWCVSKFSNPGLLLAVFDGGRWVSGLDNDCPDLARLFVRHHLALLRDAFPDRRLLDEDSAVALLDDGPLGPMLELDLWCLRVVNPGLGPDEARDHFRSWTGGSRFDVLSEERLEHLRTVKAAAGGGGRRPGRMRALGRFLSSQASGTAQKGG